MLKSDPLSPLAYTESAGAGMAVIFVHGNSLSGSCFQKQLASPLAGQYRFIAPDLPGHGRSAKAASPDDAYTLPGYANALVAFCEALRLKNAVFVGWSLGGHVILEALDRLSCRGLVLFGTPPFSDLADLGTAFLPTPAMGLLAKEILTSDELVQLRDAYLPASYAEDSAHIHEDIVRSDGAARAAFMKSIVAGKFRDERRVVASRNVPVAILHGANDPLVNLRHLQSLSAPTLWRGKIEMIPNATHAPHIEAHQRFNALLGEFLGDL